MTTREVRLEELGIDGDTQFREEQLNMAQVKNLMSLMEDDIELDPIEARFDGTTYWVSNGFHRIEAATRLQLETIKVNYKPGTLEDAQVDAMAANKSNGLPRSNETRRNQIMAAFKHEETKEWSNSRIAKHIGVAVSTVSAMRDPKVREKQRINMEKSIVKKAKQISDNRSITTAAPTDVVPEQQLKEPNPSLMHYEPSAEELEANDRAMQADIEAMQKLLDSDDALKEAHAEIKRLNLAYAQLDLRFKGLMNEKDHAVTLLKKAQKELDKLKAKK